MTSRTLSQRDFDRFAALSRDDNPIHCDPAFAATTHFGRTVAHGMFLYGLICAALTERLAATHPAGYLHQRQSLMFPAPTFASDTVEVRLAEDPTEPEALAVSVVKEEPGGGRVVTAHGHAVAGGAGFDSGGQHWSLTQADVESDFSLHGLALGQSASAHRRFTLEDAAEYRDLSGDGNPVFQETPAARRLGLARPLVPAPLLAGMFSDLLGTRLPGRGTGWMKQSLSFLAPACLGDTLTATVTVTRLRRSKELVNLASIITAEDGRTVVAGESLVLVRNLERKR